MNSGFFKKRLAAKGIKAVASVGSSSWQVPVRFGYQFVNLLVDTVTILRPDVYESISG
jgi:hypothetical protein